MSDYISRADTIGQAMANGLARVQELIQLAEMAGLNQDWVSARDALGSMRMRVSEMQEFLVRKGIDGKSGT